MTLLAKHLKNKDFINWGIHDESKEGCPFLAMQEEMEQNFQSIVSNIHAGGFIVKSFA
jgi:hypothetical protein